ncbi:MAG: hypothetical protein OXF11_08695 [Deltaproteobacteria bacterium]|nr:hypothetical protein [Deltaproteobacteria bacterium]
MERDDDTRILPTQPGRGVPSAEEEIDLPEDLIQGLARLDRTVAVMSPEADRHIAEAAKDHFADRPRRARPAGFRWAMAGSLAASLLVGVLLWRTYTPVGPADLRVATVASIPDDIDGSGAVDILDAFALARMARGDQAPAARAKVDALAMSIVALEGSAEKL